MNRTQTSVPCTSQKTGKALHAYTDHASAEDGARYATMKWGNPMVPYLCARCRAWHLSPAARQTPSHTCRSCTDASGRPKQSYATEKGAQSRADIQEREKHARLRVYECPNGDGWHLTSTRT